MLPRRNAPIGVLVAPGVALAIGVWAEFAHLTPPVLFAVSVPAIIVSTLSSAYVARRVSWPVALVVAGAVVGTITFGLAEGTHVAIHFSRGGTLDFGDYHSRAAIGAALIGVHLAAGAMVGAGIGAGLAVLSIVARLTSLTPTVGHPLPRRGRGAGGEGALCYDTSEMRRNHMLVAGLVAFGAALMISCGSGGAGAGGGGTKKCDLAAELATQGDRPAPFVSLDEARRRVAFDIVLPASLPPGAMVTGVTLIPPPCADKFSHIEIPIKGSGWILDLDELAGKFAPSSPATPIRINGVDGAIERHMGGKAPVVSVSWTVGKRSYAGFAQLTGGLTEQQFLDILESIPH